jgi:hypothetical protein
MRNMSADHYLPTLKEGRGEISVEEAGILSPLAYTKETANEVVERLEKPLINWIIPRNANNLRFQ